MEEGISPSTTRTPSGGAGESMEALPSGPRSRTTTESRLVDQSASCGPTGEEACAVAAPSPRLIVPETRRNPRARTLRRKPTLRDHQARETARRSRVTTAMSVVSGEPAPGAAAESPAPPSALSSASASVLLPGSSRSAIGPRPQAPPAAMRWARSATKLAVSSQPDTAWQGMPSASTG